MKPRARACCARSGFLLLVVFWLAAAGAAQAGADAGEVHLTRASMLVQTGVRGYASAPLDVDLATLDGIWLAVELPHATPRNFLAPAPERIGSGQAMPETVITWFKVEVPEDAALASPAYLYLPSWKSDGQIAIYADGRLIHRSHANLRWNASVRPLWLPLDPGVSGRLPRQIVIRVQHLPGIGGALSSMRIGSTGATYWRFLAREWLQVDFPFQSSAAFLALGVFAFFVWLRRRHERIYLMFFATSVAGYVRTMYYYVGQNRLPIPDAWFSWMIVNSMIWMLAALHAALTELHRDRFPWIRKLLAMLCVAIGLLTLPVVPGYVEAMLIAPWVATTLLVLGILIFGLDAREAWRQGVRDSMILGLWALLCMFLSVYDWGLHNNLVSIEGILVSSYLNVGTFYILTFIMYRRYVSAIATTEEMNANLTRHLREREAQLYESHERLREAEQKELLRAERSRMMQDMHDGLGSSLVSALRVVERGKVSDEEIADVLKSCIEDLKLTIDSLEPVDADLLLLLATLRFRLRPRLEGSGIELQWDIEDVPPIAWLMPRNSLHILRILQEAFTNIIKHTQATRIRVSTAVEGEGVVVAVEDDGRGFDVEAAMRSGGKGLANQRRRAEAISAQVSWSSGARGTVFRLWLPLKQPSIAEGRQGAEA